MTPPTLVPLLQRKEEKGLVGVIMEGRASCWSSRWFIRVVLSVWWSMVVADHPRSCRRRLPDPGTFKFVEKNGGRAKQLLKRMANCMFQPLFPWLCSRLLPPPSINICILVSLSFCPN